MREGGECKLSESSARDVVGGLNTDSARQSLVHHFEMKPVLGKQAYSVKDKVGVIATEQIVIKSKVRLYYSAL